MAEPIPGVVPGQPTEPIPGVVPGQPSPLNRGAADWGHGGLAAFGCGSVVVVFDPSSAQTVQTLDGHSSAVSRVRWSARSARPPLSTLVSADVSGCIVLWDVTAGRPLMSLQDVGGVCDLAFHAQEPTMLFAIHSSSGSGELHQSALAMCGPSLHNAGC